MSRAMPVTLTERKYHNQPTDVDGYHFPSKAEARRYQELRLMERVGAITDLRVHTRFPIIVNGRSCGYWEADFDYQERGVHRVEDVKGVRTPVYRLKRRLVEALYPVTIDEIDA